MSHQGGPGSPESERLESKRAELGGKIEAALNDLKTRTGQETGGYSGALYALQEELDGARDIDEMIRIGRDIDNIAQDIRGLAKKQ